MSSGAARTALVTGASSGIGAATAIAFGQLGWRVAIGARREDRLDDVARAISGAGGEPFTHPLDVAAPDSIDGFFDAAEKAIGPVEVVVSNAGMSIPNLLADARIADLQSEIAVNLTGALLVARRAIPGMVERRAGDLVFVTSLNSVEPRPYQVAYTAAKAGLEAAARVIERELEGTGVRSTVVRVGPTGTEFGNGWNHDILQDVLASWKYWGVQRKLHWMPAESVARAIVRVVTTPVDESYTTLVQVMPGGRKKEFQ